MRARDELPERGSHFLKLTRPWEVGFSEKDGGLRSADDDESASSHYSPQTQIPDLFHSANPPHSGPLGKFKKCVTLQMQPFGFAGGSPYCF